MERDENMEQFAEHFSGEYWENAGERVLSGLRELKPELAGLTDDQIRDVFLTGFGNGVIMSQDYARYRQAKDGFQLAVLNQSSN